MPAADGPVQISIPCSRLKASKACGRNAHQIWRRTELFFAHDALGSVRLALPETILDLES